MAKSGPDGRKFRNCWRSGNLRIPAAPAHDPIRCQRQAAPASIHSLQRIATAVVVAILIVFGPSVSLPQARTDTSEWWALGTFLQPLNNPNNHSSTAGGAAFGRSIQEADERRRAGRKLEALKVLDGLASAYPERAEVYWRRGELHMAMQNDRQAQADFDAVARLSPDAVGAHMKRGLLLARTNRDTQALHAYDEAIAAAGRRYAAITDYWKAYASSNGAAVVIDTTLSLLRRDRDRTIASAHLGRGQVHLARSRYGAALEAYNDAIAAMPDYEVAYRYRGWLNEKTGHIRSARTDYKRALEIDDTDAWTQQALRRVR